MRKVVADDVARAAGVSRMTVSRVFSGKAPVATKTRQRVRKIADRLGYHPDPLASALRGNATRTIGLIARGPRGVAAEYIQHLIHAAQEQGYLVYTSTIGKQGDDSGSLHRVARDFLNRRVDGLVIYRDMPALPAARRFLESCGVPVVFLGGWGPPRSRSRVVLDVKAGITQLAEHLAELGHRKVAYFPSSGLADFSEHKLRPTQRIFARSGLDLVMDPQWWVDGQSRIAEGAYRAVRAFLDEGPGDVTALMIINDIGALGAMAALREAGLRVPDDLSVVGFDNIDGAQFCVPPLTTMAGPDSHAVGVAAFQMLHTLITDSDAPIRRQTLPFKLVVRESTGPARLEPGDSLCSRSSLSLAERESP